MKKCIKAAGVILAALIMMCAFEAFSGGSANSLFDLRSWKGTPAWALAQAVDAQDVGEIERIVRETPELINDQEPKYGMTLLIWAVGADKYESAEKLLLCGADPNIEAAPTRFTALFIAARYPMVKRSLRATEADSVFMKLLLSYGADPNRPYVTDSTTDLFESGTTPLMVSISRGIEKTRILVDAGADINTQTYDTWSTAVTYALMRCDQGLFGEREQAHYLIVEKHADVTRPYRRSPSETHFPYKEFRPVDLLRRWMPPLDSEEYAMKMEIVDEFARQGVDYWATPIPDAVMAEIRKRYPDTWESYIKEY